MHRVQPGGRKNLLSPRRLVAGVAAIAATCVFPAASRASVITFAQFEQATGSSNSNVFAYINNGLGNDSQFVTEPGVVAGAPIPVTFTYLDIPGLPADLQGTQNAMLTLTSSSEKPVQTANGVHTQLIDGSGALSDVLTITRDTPAAEGSGSQTNLLTVDFAAILAGVSNGTTASFSADTGVANTSASYTSDFLSFSSATQEDFALAFSSWINAVDGGGVKVASDNYLDSATTAGAGTFDVNAVASQVPEPASLALTAMAVLPMLLTRRRSTRQA